jgi:hypothetical protein
MFVLNFCFKLLNLVVDVNLYGLNLQSFSLLAVTDCFNALQSKSLQSENESLDLFFNHTYNYDRLAFKCQGKN